MAVRVNSDASAIKRTANLPDDISFTMCGWFLPLADRNTFTGFMGLSNTAGGPAQWIALQTAVDGTALALFTNDSGGDVNSATIITLAVGTWYFGAITSSGVGAAQTTGYVREYRANALSSASVDRGNTAWAPGSAEWGRDGSTGEYLDGAVAHCCMFDRVLTANELLQLSYDLLRERITNRANLNVYYRLRGANDVRDLSTNARDATATFGIDYAGPQRIWKRRKPIAFVAAGGGGGALTARRSLLGVGV